LKIDSYLVIKYVKAFAEMCRIVLSDKPSVKASTASASLNKTTPGAFQTSKKTAE